MFLHERGAALLSRLTNAASRDYSRDVIRQVAFGTDAVYATDSYIAIRVPYDWILDRTLTETKDYPPETTMVRGTLLKRALGPKGSAAISGYGPHLTEVHAHEMRSFIQNHPGDFPKLGSLFETEPDEDKRTFIATELLIRSSSIFRPMFNQSHITLAPFGKNKPSRLVVNEKTVGLIMPVSADPSTYAEVFGPGPFET